MGVGFAGEQLVPVTRHRYRLTRGTWPARHTTLSLYFYTYKYNTEYINNFPVLVVLLSSALY